MPIDYTWPADEIVATFVDLWAGMVSLGVSYAATLGYEPTPDKVEPLSWDLFQKGLQLPSTKYLGSLTRLQQISRELIGWWSGIDVLLTPGLGQRPVPIGTINPQKEEEPFTALIPDASDFTPYTAVWNVTGQPAISLPLFQGDDGLPTYDAGVLTASRGLADYFEATARALRRPLRSATRRMPLASAQPGTAA